MSSVAVRNNLATFIDAVAAGDRQALTSLAEETLARAEDASELLGRIGLVAMRGDSDGHAVLTLGAASTIARWLIALRHTLGGLLATMQENMDVFAPTEESRARFASGDHIPTTVSWGANNRTTALRLPYTGLPFRRIEHRVAGADADVAAVIAVILEGVLHGLENRLEPGPQMHGNASLPMYGLPPLLVE